MNVDDYAIDFFIRHIQSSAFRIKGYSEKKAKPT